MLWQFVLTNGSKELMSSAERTHSRRETKREREKGKRKRKRELKLELDHFGQSLKETYN